tara:strand:+ start:1531 stop:3075 length:1545 start_codon:yes stop_codon:yes gene_type:complete
MANIPGYLDDSLSYVLEAVDSAVGEGTTPIHMSVNEKDIEEDPDTTKSVLFKSKIHVDKDKRTQVRDEVVHYLNGLLDNMTTLPFSQVTAGTKSNPDAEQFDVVVRYAGNKPQVIRILVKPTGGGGSGGGAAKTKVQEVGQALFLAIRYMKGKDLKCHPKHPKDCLTTADYEAGMKFVEGPGVTIQEIQSIEQKWHDAFILGANKIANEVQGEGWEFVRGDNKVEAAISDAFNRAKKSPGAPENEDKWNPSDIWMVRDKDKVVKELAKENTIDCLNNFISQAFSKTAIKNKSGKDVPPRSLIGISLKKLGPTARWVVMNEVGKTQLQKAGNVTFQQQRTLDELTAFSGMDVYFVYLSGGDKRQGSFQARNFGGDKKGQWQFELKGEYAAQGKIKGEVARKLLKAAKFKNIPGEPNFNDCKRDVTSTKRMEITEEIYNLMNGLSTKPKGWITNKTHAKAEIQSKDASWRFSKLSGLRFLAWLNGLKNGEADRAMKEMYLYASSQTDKSSVFYKVY